jgi:hypothetical protein
VAYLVFSDDKDDDGGWISVERCAVEIGIGIGIGSR